MRYSEGFADVSEAPWLVLGGGSLKGLAHIGAWRALREADISPTGIIGTSIGALIGALAASHMGWEEGRELALGLEREHIIRVNRRTVWINGIRQPSVFRGDVLRDLFEKLLPGGGWEALALRLLMNAVDLADGSTVWFGDGERKDISLVDAVYTSSALPVFYPPFQHEGRAYVDGGTSHPLAIEKAGEIGAKRIIAIDVGAGERADANAAIEQGLIGVHDRVFGIMTHRRRMEALDEWDGPPLLYVRPRLDGYGGFDFGHKEYFIEEGYRATKAALAEVGAEY